MHTFLKWSKLSNILCINLSTNLNMIKYIQPILQVNRNQYHFLRDVNKSYKKLLPHIYILKKKILTIGISYKFEESIEHWYILQIYLNGLVVRCFNFWVSAFKTFLELLNLNFRTRDLKCYTKISKNDAQQLFS